MSNWYVVALADSPSESLCGNIVGVTSNRLYARDYALLLNNILTLFGGESFVSYYRMEYIPDELNLSNLELSDYECLLKIILSEDGTMKHAKFSLTKKYILMRIFKR